MANGKLNPGQKVCGECGRFKRKDGTSADSQGYPTINVGPMRGVRVHELVAAAKFGAAKLKTGLYHIHHVNENKDDPHPRNLELLLVRDHNQHTARRREEVKREKKHWEDWFAKYGDVADPETEFNPEVLEAQ